MFPSLSEEKQKENGERSRDEKREKEIEWERERELVILFETLNIVFSEARYKSDLSIYRNP